MKMLTLHQPWASLIALGVKTIETRSWSTSYRGPLAIQAGLRKPTRDEVLLIDGGDRQRDLPLGAVVAIADLVDVVPVRKGGGEPPASRRCLWVPPRRTFPTGELRGHRLLLDSNVDGNDPDELSDVSDQLAYGDFTPGRYGWLLANVRALPTAVPCRGHQGVRDVPAASLPLVLAQLEEATHG